MNKHQPVEDVSTALAEIRAAFSSMETRCTYLSGQVETVREGLVAVEMEHLPDTADLWPAPFAIRKQLGNDWREVSR